jgi:hypothetical protein
MRIGISLLALTLATVVSLAASFSRFGPGFSMHNEAHFSESPHIAVRSDPASYSLRWRYGTMGFFFVPGAKVVDGQLLFSLQATSSSGNLRGRYGEIPITDPKHIQALRSAGAYWFEQGGQKIRLEEKKL